jgi:hypothetical protein
MSKRWLLVFPVMGFLSACATLPSGPTVMVLPGVGKPFDGFQAEDAACRQFAQLQTGIAPGQATTQSTVGSAALSPTATLPPGTDESLSAISGFTA